MDAKLIGNAIKFLERVDLKGSEVPAYVEVMQLLHGMLQNGTKSEESTLQNAE